MDLLFRLDPKLEGFENRDATDFFFTKTIPEENDYYFYDTGRNLELERNDTIYFSWRNEIVASAIFLGDVIYNPDSHDKFHWGYKLTDIKLHSSYSTLNKDIVSSWTAYIKTPEIRAEVDRVLYSMDSDLFVDENNEHLYLEAVRRTTAKDNHQEKPRKPVPPKFFKSGICYKRNPKFAAQAIRNAKFQCEINPDHQTFVSSFTNKHFTEAHHLIPLSCYELFPKNDLDTESNIVSLCPNCHRKIHMGEISVKKDMLRLLFDLRRGKYEDLKIPIDFNGLMEIYARNTR